MSRRLVLCYVVAIACNLNVAQAIDPLSVSPTDRYLINSAGQPVFLQGDAAWSLMTAVSMDDAEIYLQDRANRGFNAVIVNLIEHFYNGPHNTSGQYPFLDESNPDFTQLNDAYFDHAEEVVAAAQERGIYVLLCPAYLGYPDTQQGWYNEVNTNGDTNMREYGRLIGERFKDYNNIIWVAGGDRNPDGATSEMLAMMEGILETDPFGNLFTAHAYPNDSPAFWYGDQDWFSVSNSYSYDLSYKRVLEEYQVSPTRPVFLMEDSYENEHSSTSLEQRQSKWWAATSGTTGVIMGNMPIWLFDPGWENELNSTLSQDMARLGEFMRSLSWQKLEPDSEHRVVTDGFGDYGSTQYVTTSFADDGSLLLVYSPEEGGFTIDLSQFSSGVLFEWFDPTSGALVDAGTYDNLGNETFYTPGANAAGEYDWVFLGQTIGVTGDFDNNEIVNGTDFLAWQRGDSPIALSQSDLEMWKENYEPAPLTGENAIPEPNSLLQVAYLQILLAGMFLSGRQRLRHQDLAASLPLEFPLAIFCLSLPVEFL